MPKSIEQKRQEAEERREDYDTLKPEDQLARIEGRPGESKRERAKLLALIEARGKTAKKGAKK